MAGMRGRLAFGIAVVVVLTATACRDGIGGKECEDDSDCRQNQNCVANTCVGVCFGVQVGDGSAGSLCTTDTECDSLSCDNEERISTCTCDPCVPEFTDIGGTPDAPVVWEEKFTCVDSRGACFAGGASDNNESITFELVQDGKNLRGTIAMGQGAGDIFEGELCGDKFQWVDVTPGVQDPERGCWTFTRDQFNKRSGLIGDFRCVGIGAKGAGSTPPDVISCQNLGEVTFNAFDCPPAPPAEPQLLQ